MHPEITQAIAAQRTRELQADGAAARSARHLRRSGPGRTWRVARPARGGSDPALPRALRPMRGPRAA
jgi:hypothetical protein